MAHSREEIPMTGFEPQNVFNSQVREVLNGKAVEYIFASMVICIWEGDTKP